jgi:hypothetical protein
MILLAALGAFGGQGFHIQGFSGPALAWQLFQGAVLYGAIVAIGYALRRATSRQLLLGGDSKPLERYLIRAGEHFRPIEVNDIVTISGAQDYSEVVTSHGRHLVRLSLTEFESRLDPKHFIRVHRSTIIHLTHLERAELAGHGADSKSSLCCKVGGGPGPHGFGMTRGEGGGQRPSVLLLVLAVNTLRCGLARRNPSGTKKQ